MIVYSVVMAGTVWNAIHEPPFTGYSESGPIFFGGDMHNQFIAEGLIIVGYFLTLVILWVSIANVSDIKQTWLRLPLCVLLFLSFFLIFNNLARIFSHKKMGGGYPFFFDRVPSLFV